MIEIAAPAEPPQASVSLEKRQHAAVPRPSRHLRSWTALSSLPLFSFPVSRWLPHPLEESPFGRHLPSLLCGQEFHLASPVRTKAAHPARTCHVALIMTLRQSGTMPSCARQPHARWSKPGAPGTSGCRPQLGAVFLVSCPSVRQPARGTNFLTPKWSFSRNPQGGSERGSRARELPPDVL